MRIALAVLLCLALATIAHAFDLQGWISLSKSESDSISVPIGTKVIVDNGIYEALVDKFGRFVVYDVPEGEHVVDVISHGYAFEAVKVNIADAHATAHKHHSLTPVHYPLHLIADGPLSYFSARPPVNVLSFLKSPMVIMMMVTGVLALVMPKLMANMNPEELAEMKRMQKNMSISNWAKKLQEGQGGAAAPAVTRKSE